MAAEQGIWATVPVDETAFANQRSAKVLPAAGRWKLAVTVLEDVRQSISAVVELSCPAVRAQSGPAMSAPAAGMRGLKFGR